VCAFDSLLRHAPFAAAQRPDVVLHLGEAPASKVLGQWLQSTGALHVQVHAQGRTIDPLGIITERVYGEASTVCEAVLESLTASTDAGWLASWTSAESAAQAAIGAQCVAELTEPAVARALSTVPGRLVLSSSMPVRDVEWFGSASSTVVHSNRGANGIDGVIASAIGVAIGSNEPTTLLLGDVAFCHDQSSLTALAARQLPPTIVVVDNDGGAPGYTETGSWTTSVSSGWNGGGYRFVNTNAASETATPRRSRNHIEVSATSGPKVAQAPSRPMKAPCISANCRMLSARAANT
jgi:2-succinyl-5-enolpyruvyl-6-hydroxy-3-cyclohexene-1-carboxylate synthase